MTAVCIDFISRAKGDFGAIVFLHRKKKGKMIAIWRSGHACPTIIRPDTHIALQQQQQHQDNSLDADNDSSETETATAALLFRLIRQMDGL